MKNQKLAVGRLFVCIIFFFASSCQDKFESGMHLPVNPSEWTQDQTTRFIAKRLSEQMRNVFVREFLKEEATKQFDGDYSILLVEATLKSLGNLTFGELLFSDVAARGGIGHKAFSSQLFSKFPLLQISIPKLSNELNADTWDVNLSIPLVAFESEGSNSYVTGFRNDGMLKRLDAKTIPSELVIVVSMMNGLSWLKGKNQRTIRNTTYAFPHASHFLPVPTLEAKTIAITSRLITMRNAISIMNPIHFPEAVRHRVIEIEIIRGTISEGLSSMELPI